MRIRFAVSTLLMIVSLALMAAAVSAQDYPKRPIRIVVGFTAGGPTDVPVRFIADRLSKALGTPIVVENKPGAGSILATRDVLSQARDGYNLLACTYFDPINTLLYKQPGYKVSDIQPISLISRYDYAIAVRKNTPAETFGELVKYGQQNPGKLNYGQLGVGSAQNLVAKRLEKAADMKMTAIPYKGAADALQDVVAERLDLFIGPPFVVIPLYEAGKFKVLAVTGQARLTSIPKIPTLTESGIPIVAFAWLGICAASGTPKPIADLLNSKLVSILESDEYRELIMKSGSVPMSSTQEEMQMVINESVKQIAPLIQEFNLYVD
jgi:tripartite-type tricarboxylate transporter receptor subunit TctC